MRSNTEKYFTAFFIAALLSFSTTGTAVAATRTVTITPSPIKYLCPKHIRGDKEFAGHGPHVTARAYLFKTNGDSSLKVRIYLKAKETKHNWSTAQKTWIFPIWTSPRGKRIVGWTPSGTSYASYVDQNHQLDVPSIQGSNLVRRFEIKGDTKGNDIGNCTRDDVYMNVYFQPVRVTYK